MSCTDNITFSGELHSISYKLRFLFQVSVYKTGSVCAAFLANVGTQSDAAVTFNGNSYHLPPWSVSILPDCKNVAFSTAKVWFIILSTLKLRNLAMCLLPINLLP